LHAEFILAQAHGCGLLVQNIPWDISLPSFGLPLAGDFGGVLVLLVLFLNLVWDI
jgi:hypothetical protein